MALLYRDELQRSHYAPLCSKTSCIYFILVLICIILPFLLVIRTHSKFSLWSKPILKMRVVRVTYISPQFSYPNPSVQLFKLYFPCLKLKKVKNHSKFEENFQLRNLSRFYLTCIDTCHFRNFPFAALEDNTR